IADFNAALAMLLVANLERKERIPLIAVGVGDDGAFDGKSSGILHIRKRGLGNRLARVAIDRGLWVKAFEMANAAIHEQPDHVLRPGREMRTTGRRRPRGPACRGVAVKHRAEGESGESHA